MESILIRTGLLLLHVLINVAIIAYLTNFDISASWIRLILFILILFVLLILFIRHLVIFFRFIKTKPK